MDAVSEKITQKIKEKIKETSEVLNLNLAKGENVKIAKWWNLFRKFEKKTQIDSRGDKTEAIHWNSRFKSSSDWEAIP